MRTTLLLAAALSAALAAPPAARAAPADDAPRTEGAGAKKARGAKGAAAKGKDGAAAEKPAQAPFLTAIVACAPGNPGTTAEAQPSMDAFAAAVAARAKLPRESLRAVYVPGEKDGVARLRQTDAGVALVTLPFLVAHGPELRMQPQLAVETKGSGLSERWTLVARKGALGGGAAALDGWTLASTAGYAPGFVRGVLAGWGKLPPGAKVTFAPQILSALRKAASGEKVAVLLDGAQAASLATLPFAAGLETVATSEAVPAAIVAVLPPRMSPSKFRPLASALLSVSSDPKGAEALAGIRVARFAPLDAAAHAALRKLQEAAR